MLFVNTCLMLIGPNTRDANSACLIKGSLNFKLVFQFEEAAKEVADEVTAPRPEGEENVEDIQIFLNSDALPTSLRNVKVRR